MFFNFDCQKTLVRRHFCKKHFTELEKLRESSFSCTYHIRKSCSTNTEKCAREWACFEISLVSKILQRYFTELLCFCFNQISFVIYFFVLWRHKRYVFPLFCCNLEVPFDSSLQNNQTKYTYFLTPSRMAFVNRVYDDSNCEYWNLKGTVLKSVNFTVTYEKQSHMKKLHMLISNVGINNYPHNWWKESHWLDLVLLNNVIKEDHHRLVERNRNKSMTLL